MPVLLTVVALRVGINLWMPLLECSYDPSNRLNCGCADEPSLSL